jgi:hypothetical protein
MSVGETWESVMIIVMNHMIYGYQWPDPRCQFDRDPDMPRKKVDSKKGMAALLGSTNPQSGIIERVSKEFRGFFQTKPAFYFFYLDWMALQVGIHGLNPHMTRTQPDDRMKFLLTRETHYRKYLMILHLLAPDVDRVFNKKMTWMLEDARVKFIDDVQCDKYGYELWELELCIKRFNDILDCTNTSPKTAPARPGCLCTSLELPWSTESIEDRYWKSELNLIIYSD